MSTAGTPLSETTNTSGDGQDVAQDSLQTLRAELDAMKGLVAGFTKRTRSRKRKRRASSDSDVENDAPTSNKAKSSTVPEQDFASHGRMIMRFLGPFENIEDIITHGLRVDTALVGDEVAVESLADARLTESWTIFHQKVPGFHSLMLANHANLDVIHSISRKINTGMEGARSDDTGTLKPRILGWTAEDLAPDAKITIMTSASKATRAADPAVFALLLPLEHKAEFPDPLAAFQSGDFEITGRKYPCFLFPFGQPNDETALDTILEGPIMLRCSKALLMGPSSALQGDGFHQGKPGNASLIGLKMFTKRVIAYIACQVRFNLSSLQNWNRIDGEFDYEEFFWLIVKLFDDGPFAKKTIALYNRMRLTADLAKLCKWRWKR
ncbi:hypothetical protein B0H16DRAFT_1752117 [Mycena metata]|uniref:Uncharacterized protein n=1 Tax=Mycena metata TaxID=1033252 RepID=A0AAD7DK15_9AGAR|nr:hypothetical protein B0H16DRAFT_1752117 [Mycena metata]